MPGTLIVRPLAAKLTRNTELFGTMDPYCKVFVGKQKVEGQVCTNGGKHPHWEDTLVLKKTSEPLCHIEVKEKDWLLPDKTIGTCDISLAEIESRQRVLKWYPVTYENKPAGQLLVEVEFKPDVSISRENPPKELSENKVVEPKVQTEANRIENPLQNFGQGQNIPLPEYQQPYNQPVYPHGYSQQGAHWHQAPIHQTQETYPAYPYQPNTYLRQGEQQELWAPPSTELQHDNAYPQKYPQFGPNESPNLYSGYYGNYNNVGADLGNQGINQENVIDYRKGPFNEPNK